ncbi:MAG: hypothetical protein B7O98_05970 [Zestosphaera tikiterensis]|uniref:DUF2118 domain-containing protein n=1 Tax=Zestosphaera tikiterensis TaxID=1973259 RepID=A0A2R7Y3S8_9CREN|nr:MAG: hypothetical protein B7O98_05970 [Zestosphaera tikiterensis]
MVFTVLSDDVVKGVKVGKATDNALKYLKDVSSYYRMPECFKVLNDVKEKIPCYEIPKEIELLKDGKYALEVCNPRLNKCVDLDSNALVDEVVIEGFEVYPVVEECSEVGRNDKLAYIVTGKGEVRVVRYEGDGVVLYVDEVVGVRPVKYRVFIKRG